MVLLQWSCYHTGLVANLKSKVEMFCRDAELKSSHWIIHQKLFCTKNLKLEHVIDVMINTVNWLRSWGCNHRQVSALLEELNAQYGNLLYHTKVRWLSHGMMLKRFFELRIEIYSCHPRANPSPSSDIGSETWPFGWHYKSFKRWIFLLKYVHK